jgi:hypothetical protein
MAEVDSDAVITEYRKTANNSLDISPATIWSSLPKLDIARISIDCIIVILN